MNLFRTIASICREIHNQAGIWLQETKNIAIERLITGFHQDEHNDWVADLECGHTQHVRHQPPWQERPWVITAEGRNSHLGQTLPCKKCDKVAP